MPPTREPEQRVSGPAEDHPLSQPETLLCYLPVNGIVFHTMIKSFRCKETQKLFEAGRSKRFGSITKEATRKLTLLDAAATLEFSWLTAGQSPSARARPRRTAQHPNQRSMARVLSLDHGRAGGRRDRRLSLNLYVAG